MDNTYIFSMQERLEEIKSDLQGLHDISKTRALGRYEYRAAERSLQVLIEACIGIAKHWSYALNKTAPADAYSAFETLSQLGVSAVNVASWRKIIGMRNGLVHDYLTIDVSVVQGIIEKQHYRQLNDFCTKAIAHLQAANKLGS